MVTFYCVEYHVRLISWRDNVFRVLIFNKRGGIICDCFDTHSRECTDTAARLHQARQQLHHEENLPADGHIQRAQAQGFTKDWVATLFLDSIPYGDHFFFIVGRKELLTVVTATGLPGKQGSVLDRPWKKAQPTLRREIPVFAHFAAEARDHFLQLKQKCSEFKVTPSLRLPERLQPDPAVNGDYVGIRTRDLQNLLHQLDHRDAAVSNKKLHAKPDPRSFERNV